MRRRISLRTIARSAVTSAVVVLMGAGTVLAVTTIGTDITLNPGSGVRTGTTATNTMLLQAYDVDGAAYTTFATLTANNTPTMDLSTAVTIGGNAIQTQDAGLTSIAGLTTSADKMIYTTASDTYATTALTTFGRSILDDANEATFKATVNLEIGTDVQAYDADLDAFALETVPSGDIVGTTATQTLINKKFTDNTTTFQDDTANTKQFQFQLSGITVGQTRVLTVPDVSGTIVTTGDTGSVTNGMLADAGLISIAGLGTGANKFAYTTGVDTWAEATVTATGLSILDDTSTSAVLSTLSAAASGANSDITSLSALTSADTAATLSGTTADNLLQVTLTNNTTSGSQNTAYFDNAAGTGTTEALLVLDNSDTDTAATAAIKIVDAGGGFTSVIDNAGTLISGPELNRLNGVTGALTFVGGTDVAVADGGTGLSSYAVGDILYASGTTALSKLAAVATGNLLISGGVTTAPSWGKATLGTHTSGNYVASTATNNGLTGGAAGSAGATLTLGLDYSATLGGDPTITTNYAQFSSTGIIFEGSVDDIYEGLLTVTVAGSADRTWTLPDADGTVTVLGNTATGSGNVVLATSPTISNPTLTGHLKKSVTAAVAAAGTASGTATLITTDIVEVTSVTDSSAEGIRLPTGTVGTQIMIIIKPSTATALEIYPDTGGTINGGSTDVSVNTYAQYTTVVCTAYATSTWECVEMLR